MKKSEILLLLNKAIVDRSRHKDKHMYWSENVLITVPNDINNMRGAYNAIRKEKLFCFYDFSCGGVSVKSIG